MAKPASTVSGLQPYSAYKPSGAEWLGEVPAHWGVRRMRTVASVLSGATPSSGKQSYWDGDIVWITPHDLGVLRGQYISTSGRRISRAGYESCGATMAPANSVVVSTRAPIGSVGILNRAACTNQGCRLLVPSVSIEPEHMYYCLRLARPELESIGQGTTFLELSRERLASFPLPLPPLAEQAAIVRYLDHADRRIRQCIRAKEKLVKLMEEQKQAIINEAVTGRVDVRTGKPYPTYKDSGVEWLGGVPEHWEVVPLRRVALSRCDGPFGSGLKSSHYAEEGIRVVRLQNIGHGEFRESNSAFIAPEYYSSLGDHSVVGGDILIAGLGDKNHPAGRACVAPERIAPAMVKADCFRFRLDRIRVEPRFAALQLTATASTASALLSTGATRQRTNLQSTSARAIAIPSVPEQALIVEHIIASLSDIVAAEEAARREITLLNEYQTRLISDVVTGKLDVRQAAAQLPDEIEESESLAGSAVRTDPTARSM